METTETSCVTAQERRLQPRSALASEHIF